VTGSAIVGRYSSDIALAAGAAWVANARDGTVQEARSAGDAATGAVLETVDLAPGSAVAVAAGAPGAWVGLQSAGGVPIRRL